MEESIAHLVEGPVNCETQALMILHILFIFSIKWFERQIKWIISQMRTIHYVYGRQWKGGTVRIPGFYQL